MRSRNLSAEDQNDCTDSLPPSLSMASSGACDNDALTHRTTPFRSDADAICGTHLVPSRGSAISPVNAVRRTLTYSPAERGKRWPRRVCVFLLGMIIASIWLTLTGTLLLIDQKNAGVDRGLSFGVPDQTHGQKSIPIGVDGGKHSIRRGADKDPVPVDSSLEDTSKQNRGTVQQEHPRIVYYDTDNPPPLRAYRELDDDPMLHAPPGFEAAPQDRMKPDHTEGDCVPMHEWQTKSFPNCNLLHEYDLRAAGPGVYANNTGANSVDALVLLGQGWFRHTWRLDVGHSGEGVVLKTLRLEREFYDEFYDLHRRDAIAMERLTHSPFVMNIYGYCGQSAVNELADFGNGFITNLEMLDRVMRSNRSPDVNLLKLQIASSIAVGVAHVHEIDSDDRPSMVHYDLNPRNIAIVGTGKPKLNDFNIAEFLRWNPLTNETCGFPSRLHEPWWRAPEEVIVDQEDRPLLNEKVDVYALGNLLHHVLTTHSPRGKNKTKARIDELREKVARGEPPDLGENYTTSKDPAVVAFRKAMKVCFEADPKKRGSSREVAEILISTLMELKSKIPTEEN